MALTELLNEAQAQRDWIVAIRRELHRHPELGYHEFNTSRVIRRVLEELGIAYRHPIAETGVVATLGGGDGPCVALRADMDALPIHEAADVDFRSEVEGKMHACGHDCHMAMLLGAAKLLKRREKDLRGTVKLFFQPAEEGGAGAFKMCEAGVLSAPNVERIFGLHVWPAVPTGSIGSRAGELLASAGSMTITVSGIGGHAALPHTTVDPVVTAAKIVCELQTIVSRELDPISSGVVSVTTIHGGEAFNVIPPEVKLTGTIRSLTIEGMEFLRERVRSICTHVAAANRCEATVEFEDAYPPTVNDATCWEVVKSLGRELLGERSVQEMAPLMGGEDFSYYAQRVPGCFMMLGIRNEAHGSTFGVHTPQFKVDEDALPLGTAMHVAFAVKSLEELK